jgi:hypothetical protein
MHLLSSDVVSEPPASSEKRSIALSSNLRPAGFDELMPKR